MNKIIFKEITLISTNEQAGAHYVFKDGLNIIYGDNHVGKSSLVKSIFWILGAETKVLSARWRDNKTFGILTFSLDNENYSILRQDSSFAIYNSEGSLIEKFDSLGKGYSEWFAEKFNFNLSMNSSSGEVTQLPPAFALLPFYIDQDSGWSEPWKTFDRITQFSNWQKTVINYLVGLRTKEDQKIEDDIRIIKNQIEVIDSDIDYYEKFLDEIEIYDSLDFVGDIEIFKKEIDETLDKISEIKKKENKVKEKIYTIGHELQNVRDQINLVTTSILNLNKDHKKISSKNYQQCPTCHQDCRSSFLERFDIAMDESRFSELLINLNEEEKKIKKKINDAKLELEDTKKIILSLNNKLSIKKGEVSLDTVMVNRGVDALKRSKKEIHSNLNIEKTKKDLLLKELNDKKKEIESTRKTLRKQIKSTFESGINSYMDELGLSLDNIVVGDIYKAPVESGSGTPRTIIAYYRIINDLLSEYSDICKLPLVIDAPNQQDQDDLNWERIFDMLTLEMPKGRQMILAVTSRQKDVIGSNNIFISSETNTLLTKEKYSGTRKKADFYLNQFLNITNQP